MEFTSTPSSSSASESSWRRWRDRFDWSADSSHDVAVAAVTTSAPGKVYASLGFTGVCFLLLHLCGMNFCDPDLWHEMALFRQAISEGQIPHEDRFAYTPTVSPSIHHEWGAGAIFYFVSTFLGTSGLMCLKYLLVASVVAGCAWCALRRGAGWSAFLTTAPAMALFSSYGFTTIRAQVFTLLFLTIMLCLLEVDRVGRRWWIALWLPLHVVWLNVHAGFVVGCGLMAIHAVEQWLRRRPYWHLLPVGIALAALVYVNPYGPKYLPYLLHGLTMPRPLIVEWNPLWRHDPRVFGMFLVSLIPVIYAVRELGVRRMTGLLLLFATAYAAARHTRHLSLYCVVWTCYVPGYLRATAVGTLLHDLVTRDGRLIMRWSGVAAALCLCRVIPDAPWQLVIPRSNEAARQGLVCYPVGAVDYLKSTQFAGNLMVPFEVGGYAMWNLHPHAKVSIDGRYEVAYQPGLLEEHLLMYRARPGWIEILNKYPTDAVLVPNLSRLSAAMETAHGWNRTYDDGVYQVYARAPLQVVDKRSQLRHCSGDPAPGS